MNSAIQRAQSAFINQQIKNANLALKTARYAKAKQSAWSALLISMQIIRVNVWRIVESDIFQVFQHWLVIQFANNVPNNANNVLNIIHVLNAQQL